MISPYFFHYELQIYEIPHGMRDSLERYVNGRIKPGDFLQAVIKNDLKESVLLADYENMANLPAYVNYFYNHAPSICWGSAKKMEAWLKGGK